MQGTAPIAQVFLISSLIMMALVGFIIFFVVVYQRRLLRQERNMQEREAQHQRNLLLASIQTQEKERQRIARDLHDEIGAMLSAVKMKVSQAKRRVKADEQLSPVLAETSDLLTESIQQVRRISHDLLPPVLDKFGLQAALRDLVAQSSNEYGPQITLAVEGESRRFPTEQELGLFRVIQEMMTNALKHAQAQRIDLRLRFLPQVVHLEMQDDGLGFEVEKKRSTATGLGLRNIESRIQTIGASWEFQSTPGAGTRLTITLANENRTGR